MTERRNVSPNSSGKRSTPVDRAVAGVAFRQHGVITVGQLLELGLTRSDIDYRARSGRIHRLHRGVYAVGHKVLTEEGRFLAAVLAVGTGAVLSHISAATHWGFWTRPAAVVDVTARRRRRTRRGIRVHLAQTLDPMHVTHHARIPVTTPARTLLDLADLLHSDRALRRAAHEAEVQRLVDHDQLREQVERRGAARRGVERLAAIVAEGPAPTRSELEDRVLELMRKHGLPRPETNAVVRGMEVDFLYPEVSLVLEADGARFHATALARRADRSKQARLEAAGYRVLRLTWDDLTARERQTVQRLRRALAYSLAA